MNGENELLYLKMQGDEIANSKLCENYYHYSTTLALHIFGSSKQIELNEFTQGSMKFFEQALKCYRTDQKCSIKTYMGSVIRNEMFSILKRHKRIKPPNVIFYTDANKEDNFALDEMVMDDNNLPFQPSDILLVKEDLAIYDTILKAELSKYERQVIQYRIDGYSINEIENKLNCDTKKVYNAIGRVKDKLRYQFKK
ncbi:MAG: sigma-70 family RNA polymerase sigma factor [Thomasclavelia sp.]|jgi:RNA polymerase sporulation-specific sigma factor|nr:sigma-70 family RNA polymerase sigma factor [Thomasclavelia sp.]